MAPSRRDSGAAGTSRARGRNVISLVRTGNANSGTIDVLAVLRWIQSQGWISDISVEEVRSGFEITSSPGGMAFSVNAYSVTYTK
jgi:hypothetical protein